MYITWQVNLDHILPIQSGWKYSENIFVFFSAYVHEYSIFLWLYLCTDIGLFAGRCLQVKTYWAAALLSF